MTNKKALVVWGGWEGHEPRQCADVVVALLKRHDFAVDCEGGIDVFGKTDLARYDLIIPVVHIDKIPRPDLMALIAAVKSGVGLAGFHYGLGGSFREEFHYQFMTGGVWVAHPGDVIDYDVDFVKDDPITRGIGRFSMRSEQYYMLTDPNNEVLATTRFSGAYCDWLDGAVSPVVWKRQHAKGRVFYSSLGHVASDFDVPEVSQIFERGMLWAAR